MTGLSPMRVEYPGAGPNAVPVVVERLVAEGVDEALTRSIIALTRDAYAAQFGNDRVPRSVVMEEWNPHDDDFVAERQRLIQRRFEAGNSQYWIARNEGDTALRGFSKVLQLPGRVYLGEVMVAPPWREGFGTRLVHAPFAHGGYGANSRLELDAFEGSSVNQWYVKLGFKPTTVLDSYEIGEYSLLTRRLVIPSTVGLGGLVRRMERLTPALKRGKAFPGVS